MSVVFFEEPQIQRPYERAGAGGLIGWVIDNSRGMVKDEKQASLLLLAVAAILFAASFLPLLLGGHDPSKAKNEIPADMPIAGPSDPRYGRAF